MTFLSLLLVKIMTVIVLYSFHKGAFWVYVPSLRVQCHGYNFSLYWHLSLQKYRENASDTIFI